MFKLCSNMETHVMEYKKVLMNKKFRSVLFLCCLYKVDGITSKCHCAWMEGPGYCYWLSEEYNDKRNWEDSKAECERKDSTLGIVYSSTEREWLKTQIIARQFHWMGYIQTSAEEFRYIVNNQIDTFIQDFAPIKGSKEATRKDCAGIESQSGGSDIWWRDKKCSDKKYFVCIKVKAVESATIENQTTVATTLQTETQKRTTTMIGRDHSGSEKYKAKRPRTAPISREPVHVVAGTGAIIILVSFVAFMIGNDVTTLLCKMKLCDQEIRKQNKIVRPKTRSYIFRYNCQTEDAGHDVNLWIELKDYNSFVEINNQKTEYGTKAFKNAYVVQNGNSMDVWIKHMSIDISHTNKVGSLDNNVDEYVDGKADKNFNIFRKEDQGPEMANDNHRLINHHFCDNAPESDHQQNKNISYCDKTLKMCKPVDIPITATYVEPLSKVAIKATYMGSSVNKQDKLRSNDTNAIGYIKTRNKIMYDSQTTLPQHGVTCPEFHAQIDKTVTTTLKSDMFLKSAGVVSDKEDIFQTYCSSEISSRRSTFSETLRVTNDCILENLETQGDEERHKTRVISPDKKPGFYSDLNTERLSIAD